MVDKKKIIKKVNMKKDHLKEEIIVVKGKKGSKEKMHDCSSCNHKK